MSFVRRNLFVLALLSAATGPARAIEQQIKILTGSKVGVYYAAGQSLCKLFRQSIKATRFGCIAPEVQWFRREHQIRR